MTVWDDIGLTAGMKSVLQDFWTEVIQVHLNEMEARMGAREDAAHDNLNATIETVKAGWAALQAENANLKSQLDAAAVNYQAQLDADSEADAAKIEEADAKLAELTAQPAEEPAAEEPAPVEEPPAEETPAQ